MTEGNDLICQRCKQDHAKPLKTWCDLSDLEVRYYQLQSENERLKKRCEKYREPLALLVSSYDAAVFEGLLELMEQSKEPELIDRLQRRCFYHMEEARQALKET